jgi:hypothetical protein
VEGPEGLHVCLYGVQGARAIRVCDERHGGFQQAKDCPLYDSLKQKSQIKEEFQAELEGMTIAEIAYEYPDMAALVWVLGAEDAPEAGEDAEDEFEPQAPLQRPSIPPPSLLMVPSPKPPWWVRFLGGGRTG